MKKLLSFIVMTLMGMSLMAKPVDPTVAVRVAQNFAATQVKMVDNTAKIVYTHPMPESGQPAMYVVNVGSSAFVIVAADDIAHPVLGYSMARPWPVLNGERRSENGEPNATEGSERASLENGGRAAAVQLPSQVSGFLDDLASQIRAAQQQDITQDRETATEWQRLLSSEYNLHNSQLDLPDSVGPLLTTTWDQGQYYNALCPEDANGPDGHALTGCVATAMAQIINYWGYPVHGRGYRSHWTPYGTITVNYDSATYDYTNMPSALTATSTPQQVNAVATLMRDCGVAVNMQYGASSSGAYNSEVRAALTNHFLYLPSSNFANKIQMPDEEWNRIVGANILAGHPLLYGGIDDEVGHMFVCDGVSGDYFHFNFGWSGNGDGWYLSTAVNPGIYEFNTNQAALFDISYDSLAANNTIYTQYNMLQHSYYRLSEPIHLKGIMNDNQYSYINYALYYGYEDSSYVTFYPSDSNNQVTLYIMDEIVSEAWIYDGETTDSLLRAIDNRGGYFYHVDCTPVTSTRHALTLAFAHGVMNKGNHFLVVEDNGCRMVTGLSATSDTSVVHLQWDNVVGCSGWQVEYGIQGFVQGTGTLISVESNSVDIEGLNKRNKYDFYVRAVCGEDVYGPWCAPLNTTVKRLYWYDVVTEQPDGYTIESDGHITISSAEGLAWLARQPYLNRNGFIDDTIRITTDIDLGEYLWIPIWDFRGVFDGGGYKISNLTSEDGYLVNNSYQYSNGLIKFLRNGTIKNVNLVDCNIVSGDQRLGGLASESYSSMIYNCMVDGIIIGESVGSIVSNAYNTMIINCASFGKVTAHAYSSGICGEATDCVIRNCHSSVEPVSRTHFANSICSWTPRTEVVNCYGNYYKSGNYGICATTNEYFADDDRYYYKPEGEWVLAVRDFFTYLPYEDSLLFEDGYHKNLIDVLNKGVEKYNIAGLRLWVEDSTRDELPVLGNDIYEPLCQNIEQVTVRNILVDGVSALELSFGDYESADHYEVKYGILYDESNHWIDSVRYASLYNNPDTLYGLEPGNDYLIHVRAFCDTVHHSAWSEEIEHVFDKPYWTEVVISQPDGYSIDAQGNVSISSAEGLAWLASVVNGLNGQVACKMTNKRVSLLADVNMGAYKWKPMQNFGGTFDGYGHTIDSLYANENTDSVGFFSSIYNGEVRDLRMTNAITIGHEMAGTISGYSENTRYIDCYISSNVYAFRSAGGLIGYGFGVEMNGCGSFGTVSVGYNDCGGLIGTWSGDGNMTNSSSNCHINAITLAGLLCGAAYGTATMENCYANGTLNAGFWSGGISGCSYGLYISNCYTTYSETSTEFSINGGSPFGIIVGCSNSVTADHTYFPIANTIPAAGNTDVGLVGENHFSDTASYLADNNRTFIHPVTVNGEAQSDLLSALNAWVDVYDTAGIYRRWAADTAGTNGGYPVLKRTTCPNVPRTYINQRINACDSYTFNDVTYTESFSIIDTLQAANGCDSISIRLVLINYPVQTFNNVRVCEGQSYTFNGKTLTETGYYYDTIVNGAANGCDSIVRLWLEVRNPTSWHDARVCEGQSYIFNGRTLTESNSYYDTIFNGAANGCDSIVYLWLEVQNPISWHDARVCEGQSYTFNGKTLTETGYYYDTIINGAASGCDSIVSLWLEVRNPTSWHYPRVCEGESYTFNGRTLTETNWYYDTIANGAANGCDSIVSLWLEVQNPTSWHYPRVCEGESYTFNGRTLTETGYYYDTIFNGAVNGCDSIVALWLEVQNPTSWNNARVCEGQSYTFNGRTLTETNWYYDTIINGAVNGCDSIVYLWLEVQNPTSWNNARVCEGQSYTFNGRTLTETNSYYDTIFNGAANGCDSIVYLWLEVRNNYSYPSAEICQGESYSFAGQMLTGSGTYFDTLTGVSVNGCDSIVQLSFTVHPTNNLHDTIYLPANSLPYLYSYQDWTQEVDDFSVTMNNNTQIIDTRVNPSGTIYDNGGPNGNYSDNFDGTIIFTADEGETIKLSGDYQLEGCCDYIAVYDGYGTSGNCLLYTCGGGSVNVQTSTGYLTLRFTSDGSVNFDGFTLQWNAARSIDTLLTAAGDYSFEAHTSYGCDNTFNLHLEQRTAYSRTDSMTVCSNNLPYTYADTLIADAGTYTFTYLDQYGIDSTVTLHLTINHSTSGDTTAVSCDSFTWWNTNYTNSTNDATHTLTNAAGCDSTVTLYLTINRSTSGDTTAVACDSFTWWNTNYTNSTNEATHTLTNAAGCDSTVTLHLTINHSTTGDTTAVACDSFMWWNTNYTNSTNAATHTLTNAAGCDSVVTLHLTINNSTTGDTTAVACDSFTWWNTNYTNSTNEATHTLTNAAGCDSTVTLHLTINHSTTGDTTAVACDSFTWWNTNYTNSTNEATHTLTNAAGCDSTVTLHLTINRSTTVYDTLTIGSNELPYDYHGNNIEGEGNYTFDGETSEGCDSTTHLFVIVNQVGIGDVQTADGITLFPNPTRGSVTVSGNGLERVEVMDVVGCTMLVIECQRDSERIDLSDLPQGAYVVRITTHNGTAVRRVVKK